MSYDDDGERSQPPTERRRREARSRGHVARSSLLVTAVVMFATTVTLWSLGESLCTDLSSLIRTSITSAHHATRNEESLSANVIETAFRIAVRLAPLFVVLAGAVIASNLVQTGYLWVPTAVLPDLGRLDPERRWRSWWSLSSWIELGLFPFRFVLLIVVLILYVRLRLGPSGPLAEGTAATMLSIAIRLLGECGIALSIMLLVASVFDYGWQYWKHERSLMMTIEEVRREHREDNGDPRIKREQRKAAHGAPPSDISDLASVTPV